MRTIKRWPYRTPNVIIGGRNLSKYSLRGEVEIVKDQSGFEEWYAHLEFKPDIEVVDATLYDVINNGQLVDVIITPIEGPISRGNPGFKGRILIGNCSFPVDTNTIRRVTLIGSGPVEEIVN